jgi:hypothetical protein
MDSKAGDVFIRALEGCHELEQAFPSDSRLKMIVRSLEQWAAPRTGAAGQRPARVPLNRIHPRYLKPLDENVANLVYAAVDQARKQQLIT